MQSQVAFRSPLDYPLWFLMLGVALLAAAIGAMVVLKVVVPRMLGAKKEPAEKKPSGPAKVFVPTNIAEAKMRYMSQLDALRAAYDAGQVDTRVAYEEISRVSRSFAHEATGIDTLDYTLEDLRRSPWPALAELIEICYEPEFAEHSAADARAGIEHAKAVIWSWR